VFISLSTHNNDYGRILYMSLEGLKVPYFIQLWVVLGKTFYVELAKPLRGERMKKMILLILMVGFLMLGTFSLSADIFENAYENIGFSWVDNDKDLSDPGYGNSPCGGGPGGGSGGAPG
jgi:hypothetical protein